jgi:signal transduction histidine kinase
MMRLHEGTLGHRAAAGRPSRTAPRMHFFPVGPLCSLKRAMLMWLVPLFLLVGATSAVISYWSYSHMVGEFMDDQMQQLGQSILAQDDVMPPMPTRERVHELGAYVVQVFGPDGRLIASSWPAFTVVTPMAHAGFEDAHVDGTPWRVYATGVSPRNGRRVEVFQSGTFRAKVAAGRAATAIVPVLVLLPLAIFILWSLARAMSRAIHDIGRQAAQQDEHHIAELSLERVPHELQPMVRSFNGLLARLRDAFAAQRRLVQDAAHELRTPITAVALQLENVRRDMPKGACAQSFAQLEAGVWRAQRLVDQLLKLSRQDTTVPAEAPVPVDLHATLRESIGALIAQADQRGIDLGLVAHTSDVPAPVLRCSTVDLRSVVDNLIENALRYTPQGGVVDVHLRVERGHAVIEVIDTGPGIPPELLARVFDRFFRVPGTEARGNGLGLAIAQTAAQRCGLRIELRNRTDRSGLVARIEPDGALIRS